MATEHTRRRQRHRDGHNRPRMGRHPRTQYAAAALVAVDALSHDRVGRGLLGGLSGLAARLLVHDRCARLEFARRGRQRAERSQSAARADEHQACRDCRSAISRPTRHSPTSPMRKAAHPSARIADRVTARAAAAPRAIPNLNDNDWLWGGTLEQIQQTIEFGIRSGHQKARESQMPAFGKDGMLKRDEIATVGELCAVDRRTSRRARVLTLAQAGNLHRQLCGLSWARRQGQQGARRAEPDRWHLAVRL